MNSVKYNFSNADIVGIIFYLDDIDWVSKLNNTDIECAIDVFYTCFYNPFEIFVPLKQSTIRSTYPMWFTPELKQNIMQKNVLI